jgi:hypothetical protein
MTQAMTIRDPEQVQTLFADVGADSVGSTFW